MQIMSRRGATDVTSENRKNPPAAPAKGGMKLKKSPKKQGKTTAILDTEVCSAHKSIVSGKGEFRVWKDSKLTIGL